MTRKPTTKEKKTLQRPDLSGVHGNRPTEETHEEGEHRPEDRIDGGYPGEHGARMPKPKRRER